MTDPSPPHTDARQAAIRRLDEAIEQTPRSLRRETGLLLARCAVARFDLGLEPAVAEVVDHAGAGTAATLDDLVQVTTRVDGDPGKRHVLDALRAFVADGDDLATVAHEVCRATGDAEYVSEIVSPNLDSPVAWQYQFVAQTALAREVVQWIDDDADRVRLIRTAHDGPAQMLNSTGEWEATEVMSHLGQRSDFYWSFLVSCRHARDVVGSWVGRGALEAAPLELAERARRPIASMVVASRIRRRDRERKREELQISALLDEVTAQQICTDLLDEEHLPVQAWLERHGHIVAPTQRRILLSPDDYPVASALRALGVDLVRVVDAARDDLSRHFAIPPALLCPVSASWLEAAKSAMGPCTWLLVTDEQFRFALIMGPAFDLVIGPASFVETVLGASAPIARRRFADFVSEHPNDADLVKVASCYQP